MEPEVRDTARRVVAKTLEIEEGNVTNETVIPANQVLEVFNQVGPMVGVTLTEWYDQPLTFDQLIGALRYAEAHALGMTRQSMTG